MHRCLHLAQLGLGNTAPNPMVGALLVYKDRVIGEGYHRQYGQAHAEVNCINSVSIDDKQLIPESTLYVSLEPCAHFGKTPPCTNLIIGNKIPNVIIGCKDSFAGVDGKGIEKLKNAGINVIIGVLEKECLDLNKRFFTFHDLKRPYIILKWAQSNEGKIAAVDSLRTFISNELTNRRVHKWRSKEAAIMIGTNTALKDDPALTTRLWPGKNPLRLVIDKELKLPENLKLFDGSAETIVFNYLKTASEGNVHHLKLNRGENILKQVLAILYQKEIQSLFVEGGTKLLQSFIDESLWDEARIICNAQLSIKEGLEAPVLKNNTLLAEEKTGTDVISYFTNGANRNTE